jgi:polygalacturonase
MMIKNLKLHLIWGFACCLAGAANANPQTSKEDNQTGSMLMQASAPGRKVKITEFGAVNDGTTSCTIAVQRAIDELAASGGGRVIIPEGRFLSGPLVLRSGIDLHLAKGSVLVMSNDPADFPVKGNDRGAFLLAENQHDIVISGEGTIDGQGTLWWKNYLIEKQNGIKAPRRPQLVAFRNCDRVGISEITTLNPPNTHYSLQRCHGITVRGIKAIAPDDSPNTDALNLSTVTDVLIEKCEIRTGDDNIVLLCGDSSKDRGPGVQNVIIRDCIIGVGHGISIGSFTSGGIRNIRVERVTFEGTTSGIRMKANRGRGGLVQDIQFRDIAMKNVKYPIYATSYYPRLPDRPEENPPTGGGDKIPIWKDIVIERIRISEAENSVILWGLPEQKIEKFLLKDAEIFSKNDGLVIHGDDIKFVNVRISSKGNSLRTSDADVTGYPSRPYQPEIEKGQ